VDARKKRRVSREELGSKAKDVRCGAESGRNNNDADITEF
jgi:hypothetical protein